MTADILIPVFNGLEHLQRCVDSVLSHTPDGVRIVIADDASTDPAVRPYLERLESEHGIEVVFRPQNLGFVGNVNDLMRRSERDVIVLNSDTLVTAGWYETILDTAAQSERIGSVTPLSNNAEIASVPQMVAANEYPPGVEADLLGDIAATVGTGRIIEIPTAVGFCMWLRREALDEVGLFDEEAFGKGYGEENDLSLRMRWAGWLNVLADRAFVFHVGGVSFESAGTGRLRENLAVLGDRWPTYHKTIARFIRKNPLRGVQARFGAELLRRTKTDRRRVLFVVHNPLFGKAVGGTEFHVQDLVEELRSEMDCLVLHPVERGLDLQWFADGWQTSMPVTVTPHEPFDSDGWLDSVFAAGIDVIHVHHTMRFRFPDLERLLVRAQRTNTPVLWTLHDYYAMCPQAQLLDADTGEPCRSLYGAGTCSGCEDKAWQIGRSGVDEWRSTFAGWLEMADRLIVPSEAAADVVHVAFPHLDLEVIEHGMDRPGVEPAPPPAAPPYRLAVLGYAGTHKGDRMLGPLIERLADLDIHWHLFGRKELPEGVNADLTDRIHIEGRYRRADLPRLLRDAGIHATVLLSPWPETYSYTLSETWLAGLPAFGPDIGAIGMRIRAAGAGTVFASGDADAAAAGIRAAIADTSLLTVLRAKSLEAAHAIPSLADRIATYREMYGGDGVLRDTASRAISTPMSTDELERLFGWSRVVDPAT